MDDSVEPAARLWLLFLRTSLVVALGILGGPTGSGASTDAAHAGKRVPESGRPPVMQQLN